MEPRAELAMGYQQLRAPRPSLKLSRFMARELLDVAKAKRGHPSYGELIVATSVVLNPGVFVLSADKTRCVSRTRLFLFREVCPPSLSPLPNLN
jgi:hypothetical protein